MLILFDEKCVCVRERVKGGRRVSRVQREHGRVGRERKTFELKRRRETREREREKAARIAFLHQRDWAAAAAAGAAASCPREKREREREDVCSRFPNFKTIVSEKLVVSLSSRVPRSPGAFVPPNASREHAWPAPSSRSSFLPSFLPSLSPSLAHSPSHLIA